MDSRSHLFLASALIKSATLPSALIGTGALGAAGAVVRGLHETEADHKHKRTVGQRMLRGFGRGTVMGLGATAGATIGDSMSGGDPKLQRMLMIPGALAGAYAGYKLPEQKNQYD